MSNVDFGDLVGRMAISLVVVLALVFGAYAILKRRQNPSGPRRSMRVPRGPSSLKPAGKARGRSGLKIVGRVGLSRTSSVVAVQFAERVFMVGSSEQGPPSVLAELDLSSWTAATEAGEELVPLARPSSGPLDRPVRPSRSTLLEALREATARRV